eukprot:Seg2853.3 transcript_id=Seg2853.3/GoldUCD/mRNA.D3Y31 product="hypothetical protein" protein_id=Seg2853.3/GoldUCD/D3Y31
MNLNMNRCLAFLIVVLSREILASQEWSYEKYHKDSGNPFQNVLRNLGLEKTANTISLSVRDSFQKAFDYNDFERDWNTLKSEPINPFVIGAFLQNTTLPVIVRSSIEVNKAWRKAYHIVMGFTRAKCDKVLGAEAPLHPWNIIKQDKETVSFVVFVYAVSLSLILIKICSLWNFIGLLTTGYLVFIFGGPHFCFRWLIFMTGVCWFLFEMILAYPIHAAAVFLALFFWPYISSMVTGGNAVNGYAPASEYRQLKGKVERIEYRTNELQQKLLDLEDVMKRFDSDGKL